MLEMRKTLAFIALAIAGFAFGFAGCGDDDEGSPGDTGIVTTFGDTTTDGMTDETSTEDTTTAGTSTDDTGERSKTNEDDGSNSGKGGGGGDRKPSPPPL